MLEFYSMETRQEQEVRTFFEISVLCKGALSLAEVLAGVLAFFIPVSTVTNFVVMLTQGELVEDPSSFIATHLVQLAHQYAFASGTFIAVYLISRGLIKVGLVAALLKNQLWAYPASLVVLGLFIVYQLYELLVGFSSLILLITVFDLIVVYFIWREYTIIKNIYN